MNFCLKPFSLADKNMKIFNANEKKRKKVIGNVFSAKIQPTCFKNAYFCRLFQREKQG